MSPQTQPAACTNCGQPLPPISTHCPWCGASQLNGPPPVAPPGGPLSSAAAPTTVPAHANTKIAGSLALDQAFAGAVAPTGARLASLTIDVVATAVAATTTAVALHSAAMGAVVAGEAIVMLWVLEARTGLTLGNAVLRLRTSRVEAPRSPGLGRAWIRHAVTAAGFLALGVGAWVVAGSGAMDSSKRGHSWSDKASSTIVVTVPRRKRTPKSTRGSATTPPPAPQRTSSRLEPHVSGLSKARVEGGLAKRAQPIDDSEAVSRTGPSPAILGAVVEEHTAPPKLQPPHDSRSIAPVPGLVLTPPAAAPAQASSHETSPAPVLAPAPGTTPAPHAAEPNEQGALLIVFDTGHREQIPLPAAINLGRKPSATAPGDHLISVSDPEGTVSKTHLRLEHSRGRTWVTDHGSTNGTDLLDEEGTATPVTPGQRTQVHDGMRVRMGNRAFTISVLMTGGVQ